MAKQELQREIHDEQGIRFALAWAEQMIRTGLKAGPVRLSLGRLRRTLDQNAKLWPMCNDIAKQCEWYGRKMPADEWKDLFVAGVKQQKAVPNMDGTGFIIVGGGSSKLNKQQFSDLIELIYAFGAEHGVDWSEPAKKAYDENRRAA